MCFRVKSSPSECGDAVAVAESGNSKERSELGAFGCSEREIEEFDCFEMLGSAKQLREDIRGLESCWDMLDVDLRCSVNRTNKVMPDIDVFGASVLDVVFNVIESRIAVRVDRNGARQANIERMQ